MKLYYFETPNPRKPCAVAKYLGLPVEYVRVDLTKGEQQTPDFLAVNPNGKVPALHDCDVHLWEGHAIMVYLAMKAGSGLWPKDEMTRLEIMKWLNWDTAHFGRHGGRLLFENFIRPSVIGEPTDPKEVEDATKWFTHFAGILDGHLADRKWIVGDAMTVADFGVAAFLPSEEQAKLPLQGRSNIARWHGKLNELDAWRNPWPA